MATIREYAGDRRAKIGVTAAALLLVGASSAAAASLNVEVSQAGAGVGTISSCDSSVDFELGTPVYNDSIPGYEFTTVDYSNVDPSCDTQTIAVTVVGTFLDTLATGSDTLNTDTTGTITLSAGVNVNQAAKIYSAIYG